MKTRYPDSSDEVQSVRVREVAESIQYGHTASAISRKEGPRFLRITDIQNGGVDWDSVPSCDIGPDEVPKYKLSAGDLVFARTGATTGKSFLIRECPDAVFASYLIRVRASKEVDPRYLALFFQSPDYWQQIERGKRGIGQPNVNGKVLGEIALPLPGLADQRRIVAEIEKQFTRLETAIAALRRTQANLKRYSAAVLKAACEGRLVPGDLKSWRQINLGEVAESMKNGVYKPRSAYAEDGVACLRMYNIDRGKIVWKDIKRMILTSSEVEEYGLVPGDLLVNRVNSRELVGKAAPIPSGLETCVFESKNIRVRLKRDLADPRFMGFAMGVYGQAHFNRNAQQVVGMASISQPQVAALAVPFPPLTDQTRIVEEVERRLSIVEELGALVSANLQRAARLRQSILQQAFAGKLASQGGIATAPKIIKLPETRCMGRPNAHFARTLLSAEIVHRLHGEPTFGRIKHQKIFHLCEHIAKIEEIKGQYHREAAGPLDNKLIYANEAELKKQKWYQEVPRHPFGHAYQPLAKAGGHRKYAEQYWPIQLPLVEKVVELMRTWDTNRCEIFCTTYAAWNDLILWGKESGESAILEEILEHWHESKRRFSKERWQKAIGWIREKGFVPTGFGKPTRKRE